MPLLAGLFILGQAAWKTYPLGGVILQLPKAPKAFGNPGEKCWKSMAADGSTILITVDLLEAKPLESLGATVLAVAEEYQGTLTSQSDLLANGWPGIEAAIRAANAPTYRLQSFCVKEWLFTVAVIGNDRKIADRVFRSISFAPRFGSGSLKAAGPQWTPSILKPFTSTAEFPSTVTTSEKPLDGFASPLYFNSSDYGNRRYSATVATLKDEAIKTPEDVKKGIRTIGDGAISGAKATLVRRTESTLDGLASERVESTLNRGNVTIITECTVMGNQLIVVGATVPTPLKDSPEVKHFFSSFKSK